MSGRAILSCPCGLQHIHVLPNLRRCQQHLQMPHGLTMPIQRQQLLLMHTSLPEQLQPSSTARGHYVIASGSADIASTSSSDDTFAWPAETQPAAEGAEGWSADASSSSASLSSSSSSSPPPWAARLPTWNDSTRKHLHHMMDLFTLADRDGNGVLDREEIRNLLQTDVRCTAGICFVAQHRWVSEDDLDDIMMTYDSGSKGGLTFNEFMELVLDGVLLDGTFDEYRAVFAAADENGDGCLDLQELAAVLGQLGQPLSLEDVQAIMESADVDKNSVIDFNEFLRLFHTQLLDLPRLLRYIKMKPLVLGEEVPPGVGMAAALNSGSITLVSGAAQWQGVMTGVPPTTLLVALFGLSTDIVCATTAAAVQELAAVYRSAVFVRVHIDASPDDKALFKNTLLGRATPAFFFFRGGRLLHSHASASAAVLEQHLREHLPAREQPMQTVLPAAPQQQQQQQQQQDGQLQQQQLQTDPQLQQQQQRVQGPGGSVDASLLASALGVPEGQGGPKGFSVADLVYDAQD